MSDEQNNIDTPEEPTTLAAKSYGGPLGTIKKFIDNPETRERLSNMLGKEAGTFTNSIINVVGGSPALTEIAQRNPASIMKAAMRSASVKLPIDPALGFAAIVPYKDEAQWQLMYKGAIQLCIRSGQYETIHDTEVYKDEIVGYNPITGVVEWATDTTYAMRERGDWEDVAGFYCEFRLLSGFHASLYRTKEQVVSHAKRFSKAYQRDLRTKKASSPWSTDPIPMGRKTVILGLLGRYGIMSVEMQRAMIYEEDDYAGAKYVDSEPVNELTPTNGRQPFGFTEEQNTTAVTEQQESEGPQDSLKPEGDEGIQTQPPEVSTPDREPAHRKEAAPKDSIWLCECEALWEGEEPPTVHDQCPKCFAIGRWDEQNLAQKAKDAKKNGKKGT